MAEPQRTRYERTSNRVFAPTPRVSVCVACEMDFLYQHVTGTGRKYCSDTCRKQGRKTTAASQAGCTYNGCTNPSGYAEGICNSCYYRRRRTGTLEKRKLEYRSTSSHGYVKLWDPNHPLSVSGYVYEHRAILFAVIGFGPHPCRWCGDLVDWIKGTCSKGSLVPDHLDGEKSNNLISNLVPACNKCNSARGLFQSWVSKHRDDPWLWKMYQDSIAGVYLNANSSH